MSKKRRSKKKNYLGRILIVVGVAVLAAVVLILKVGNNPQVQTADTSGDLPATQLQNALAEHRPTLAFFHSYTCQQCIEMIGIVEQVYPDFAEVIVLVDIDVDGERNEPLLRQVGLQYIPTLIFYDRTGQGQIFVGVMEAEQLRQTLMALAEGD
jgi:thioredoxin-like negative regulator of GroEL